jgi:hypothetical protein
MVLLVLLEASVGLLAFSHDRAGTLRMFGREVAVVGRPKAYARRLLLAEELVKESGKDDWAVGLGMIHPKKGMEAQVKPVSEVI